MCKMRLILGDCIDEMHKLIEEGYGNLATVFLESEKFALDSQWIDCNEGI